MPRVFACLALCNLMLLVGTAVAGVLRVGGTVDRHIMLAVLSLIFTCFLQVLTFTYFTVTGKMIAQAVHLAKLPTTYLDDVRRHKRTVTRLLAVCFVGVVLSAGTGGALWRAGAGSVWHLVAAAILFLSFLFTFYHELNAIVLNARMIDTVMREYNSRKQSDRIVGDSQKQNVSA